MNNPHIYVFSLALVLLLSGCQPEPEAQAAPRPVWVMKIANSAGPQSARYTGEVKSRYESNIGFRINGKITSRAVNVGDLVKKGQLIAQLDPSDTRLNAQAASAEVQTAQANLALAQAELERRQQLYRQQFISKSALDSYETQVKTSAAKLAQAKSQATVSQHQTGYNQLLADRSGAIGMIQAEPGQVVSAGQTIAQIYDLQTLEILIAVPESVIDSLHVGDSASVTVEGLPQPYQARIREISPAANSQTHAFDLRIQLLEANAKIKLGMTADVRFLQNTRTHTIIVPSTAVTQFSGQSSVWMIDAQQQAHRRAVTTGNVSEAGVEITSGLQANETIATIGVHTLTEGMHVQPVNPGLEVLR